VIVKIGEFVVAEHLAKNPLLPREPTYFALKTALFLNKKFEAEGNKMVFRLGESLEGSYWELEDEHGASTYFTYENYKKHVVPGETRSFFSSEFADAVNHFPSQYCNMGRAYCSNHTKIKMYDFEDGNGLVPAHRHQNGGGWVANTAFVDPLAYVGKKARVYQHATLSSTAKVFNAARVYGQSLVRGIVKNEATVRGLACVGKDATVAEYAEVSGRARVTGNSLISDYAVVRGLVHSKRMERFKRSHLKDVLEDNTRVEVNSAGDWVVEGTDILHHSSAPARILPDGTKEYYLNDEEVSRERVMPMQETTVLSDGTSVSKNTSGEWVLDNDGTMQLHHTSEPARIINGVEEYYLRGVRLDREEWAAAVVAGITPLVSQDTIYWLNKEGLLHSTVPPAVEADGSGSIRRPSCYVNGHLLSKGTWIEIVLGNLGLRNGMCFDKYGLPHTPSLDAPSSAGYFLHGIAVTREQIERFVAGELRASITPVGGGNLDVSIRDVSDAASIFHLSNKHGPAFVRFDKLLNTKYESYWEDNVRHRPNGPAYIWYDESGNKIDTAYFVKGKKVTDEKALHSQSPVEETEMLEDGTVVTFKDGRWENAAGRPHHTSKPVSISDDGFSLFALNGHYLSEERWQKAVIANIAPTSSARVKWHNIYGLVHNPNEPAWGKSHYLHGAYLTPDQFNRYRAGKLTVKLEIRNDAITVTIKDGKDVAHNEHGPAVTVFKRGGRGKTVSFIKRTYVLNGAEFGYYKWKEAIRRLKTTSNKIDSASVEVLSEKRAEPFDVKEDSPVVVRDSVPAHSDDGFVGAIGIALGTSLLSGLIRSKRKRVDKPARRRVVKKEKAVAVPVH